MPEITVGIDGSSHSHKALEWAAKEAALRKVPLTVVTVLPVAVSQWTGLPISYEGDQAMAEKVREQAEDAVRQTVAKQGDPAPPAVNVRVLTGAPASELVEASASADLLVVGSRGAGGFARLMIGSVSSQVVSHADCPVVVIPPDR